MDDWFNKPGANLTGQKKGEFEVDGDVYEVYQNQRNNAPSIKGYQTFPQYFSVRKSNRSCGHIDVTAHFKKWEELGLKMGKMYEAKLLVEAGGGAGSFDVTYFKMTDAAHPLSTPEVSSSSKGVSSSSSKIESSSSVESSKSSASETKSSSSVVSPESSSSEEKSSSSAELKLSSSEVESSSSDEASVIGSLRNILTDNSESLFFVFDMQGRYLGTVEYKLGLNLEQVLLEKFCRSGVYLVRRGKANRIVRVTAF